MQETEILLGVSGGISAYKAAELTSRLVQRGCAVSVVLTRAARRFVGKATFEALTNRPVHTSLFSPREHPLGEHIGLARRAKLFVVAPATADCLAKFALGLADDLLSTLYLAFPGPVIVAPAMNNVMWAKPTVQRNVEQLRADGVHIVPPTEGWLSCGTSGAGRMAEPDQILLEIERQAAALPKSP